MGVDSNFPEFFSSFKRETRERKSETLASIRSVAIGTFRMLSDLSPVKTGRYRASHDLTIGAPSRFRARGGRSRIHLRDREPEALSRLDGIKLGQSVFITNNAPHAHLLENGTRRLAPQKIYERARIFAESLTDREASRE